MSLPPVEVNFKIGGVADVLKAFQTIEQAMLRNERGATTSATRATRDRVRGAEQEAKEKIRAEDQATKERIRLYKFADREVARAQRDAVRDVERSEREKSAIAAKWLRQRERETRDSQRRLAQEANKDTRFRESFGRAIGSSLVYGARSAGSMAISMAGAALSLGGGFSIIDSVHRRTREMGQAADIANAGYMPLGEKAENKSRRSSGEVQGAAKAVGLEFGMETGDVQSGLAAFVGKTGDLAMGLETMRQLAELSTATGASFENMSSAAAEVFNSNTNQSAKDLMITMRALAGQGKIGAVEIKDLASQAAKITASAGQFAGSKQANVITLGAIAQEAKARGGATSAAEAATSVARLASDVGRGADKKFAEAGINVHGGGGLLKDPETLIKESISRTRGDVTKLTGLFGERSVRGVLGFAEIYRNAGGNSTDPKKQAIAMAAVTKEFQRLRSAAMSEVEQKESAARRMQESDMQWNRLVLQLRDVTATELLPAFMKLAPAIKHGMPGIAEFMRSLGKFAAFAAENPFQGIGAILGAKIGAEVGSAGIAKLLEKAFIAAGVGGNIAIAMATIAVAAGMFAINEWADKDAGKTSAGVATSVGASNTISSLRAKLDAGTLTQQDVQEAGKLSSNIGKEVAKRKANFGNEGLVGGALGTLGVAGDAVVGFVDPEHRSDSKSAQRDRYRVEAEQLNTLADSLRKLNAQIETSEKSLKQFSDVAKDTQGHPRNWPHTRETMSDKSRGASP